MPLSSHHQPPLQDLLPLLPSLSLSLSLSLQTMMGVEPQDSDHPDFVEVDPDGRYGRYNEVLGKGASKTVYRAFDEYEGVEVAWNQVKLSEFLQSPEDLERLYCEIHLLKTLKHKNIMKLYTSWVDTSKRNINFVTELFTSGTLRQYRQKHKRVHMRAVKHWCRQILRGLLYLHSHDPPIIHRDLKCDNIFINGNQGVVKIGDLGLAAILRKPHAAHCVGTPEFMAPEVYEEEYDELVDIYAFGMCVLEMLTFEYPYSECAYPAQIYKKVISGSKPEALSRIEDAAVRRFVEKCLAAAWQRLSARELLEDPFLRIDDRGSESWEGGDISKMCQILRQPSYNLFHTNGSSIASAFGGDLTHELRTENGWLDDGSLITNWFDDDPLHDIKAENGWDYNTRDFETHGSELFSSHDDDPLANVDITIKGRMTEDGGIFLRLRIADNEGRVRNIYFPFDIGTDSAVGVAAEMVGELDITDHDVTRIAEMIDGEVSSLVHEWNPGPGTEEMPGFSTSALDNNLPSNVSSCRSLHNYISEDASGCEDCAAMHGRFEEITYQVEGSEQCVSEGATALSTTQSKVLGSSSPASRESSFDQGGGQFNRSANTKKEIHTTSELQTGTRECVGQTYSDAIQRQFIEAPESRNQRSPPAPNISDDRRNKTHEELRWLTSKRQTELRDRRNQQSGERHDFVYRESRVENGVTVSSACRPCTALQSSSEELMKSFQSRRHFSFRIPPRRNLLQTTKSFADISTGNCFSSCPDLEAQCPQNSDGCSESMSTAATGFCAGVHLPSSICRTKSLPLDAVERNM